MTHPDEGRIPEFHILPRRPKAPAMTGSPVARRVGLPEHFRNVAAP